MSLGYILKRVTRINFSQLCAKIQEVHSKSGKNLIGIVCDMAVCGAKYQAGYMDYALFEMYALNKSQRRTVVTRGINNGFIKRFNDPAYIDVFDDKIKFAQHFSEYMGREWLCLQESSEEELLEFADRHPVFIAKPVDGMCGKGIEKINIYEFHRDKLYKYLKDRNLSLLEECVVQHPKMLRLHPYSVNTCRVITLHKDGCTHVVAAYLRIGNGKYVDNFNSGGMVVPVEEETGEIIYPALDKGGRLYYSHPLTKVNIKGFRIPLWDKVIKLAKDVGGVVPQVGLVGWDIAVCGTHALLIEGNCFPGHDIYGLPPHRENGIGVLPKFIKAIEKG